MFEISQRQDDGPYILRNRATPEAAPTLVLSTSDTPEMFDIVMQVYNETSATTLYMYTHLDCLLRGTQLYRC